LEHWYASATLVDAVITLTVLELLALWGFHKRTGRGLAPADYLLNGFAGLGLMVALRGALTPQWGLVALGLLAAGVAHYADLLFRARRKAY
jgi:hypothetical protein